MNIYIGFNEKKNKINIARTVYKYLEEYSEDEKIVQIFSSKKLSKKEIESLGKIFFNEKKILEKGYVDLVIDKYIINII